jgi:MoxR-like ATPase
MKKRNPAETLELAHRFMDYSKKELTMMARSLGWRGDEARTPMLAIALWMAATMPDDQPSDSRLDGESDQSKDESKDDQPDQSKSKDESKDESKQDESKEGQPESKEGQPESKQPESKQPESKQDESKQPESKQDESKQDESKEGQPESKQDESKQDELKQEESKQDESKQDEAEPPLEEPPVGKETSEYFKQLLKRSGIVDPHRILEKVWRLASIGKQNILLIGPAGCGKTMLAEQLARLLSVPFGSVSCTMGMSESQLLGWLLPSNGGNYEYRASPMVKLAQQSSVFLFDELDAADNNTLLIVNSLLANGFVSVPQSLDTPMIERHVDSIIIANANTMAGATADYAGRTVLDAATLDRFYPIVMGYDESYEHNLFVKAGCSSPKRRMTAWRADNASEYDAITWDTLGTFFFELRGKAETMRKIVSTRFAKKLIAAVRAGVPIKEVKTDLLSGWTKDELARAGVTL